MARGVRPEKCSAIASQGSHCSFSRRISASSSGVYPLLEAEVDLEWPLMDDVLLRFAARRLVAGETELRFILPW
jgi:hypothetical protein